MMLLYLSRCVLIVIPVFFLNIIQGQEECKPYWSLFENNCYRIFTTWKTFVNAEGQCRSEGGYLTSISSLRENEFIRGQMARLGRDVQTVWIGLSDNKTENTFLWLDGLDLTYTSWAIQEPNNAGYETVLNPTGQEDCVDINENTGMWNDLDCNLKKGFMCKTPFSPKFLNCPADITMPISPSTTKANVNWTPPIASNVSGLVTVEAPNKNPGDLFPVGITYVDYTFTDLADNETEVCTLTVTVIKDYCPQHWTLFKGNCYYISDETRRFEDAKSACISIRGNLTSILSPEENNFIGEQMDLRNLHSAWIGLEFSYTGSSNTFQWLDGSDMYFREWSIGEPSGFYIPLDVRRNMESSEDCGAITHFFGNEYEWFDEPCSLKNSFICKKLNMDEFVDCTQSLAFDIELGLETERSVFWFEPYAHNPSNSVLDRTHVPGSTFMEGVTTVNYTILFLENLQQIYCSFDVTIQIVDTKPPEIRSCPDNIAPIVEPDLQEIPVYWPIPEAFDYSNNVTVSGSQSPGDTFTVGVKRNVYYTFTDSSGNEAICKFRVQPIQGHKYIPSDGRCAGDSWTVNKGFCYHLSDCRQDYEAAVSSCESISATLTSIRNSAETSFLRTILQQKFTDYNFNIWIGFNDISVEGEYRWMDGSENADHSYRNFDNGEPNDHRVVGAEDCIEMKTSGFWNDVSCDGLNYFICKKSLNKPIQCPPSLETIALQGQREKVVYWEEPENVTFDSRKFHAKGSHFSGDLFPVGETWLNYTLQDSKGEYSHCTFSITVLYFDTTPPSIEECPSNIIHQVERGTPKTPVYWSTPLVTDDSEVVFMNQTHAPGDDFTTGSHDVIYMFIDDYENIAVCQFKVTVIEVKTRPPKLINCPPGLIAKGEVESRRIRIDWIEPYAKDPSENVTLLVKTHSSGDLFPLGTTLVSYFFVDSFFNMAACNFTLLVKDVDLIRNLEDIDTKDEVSTYQQGSSSSSMIGLIILLVILLILLIVLIILVIYFYRKSKSANDSEYLNMDVK